jgi:hypothetical protein
MCERSRERRLGAYDVGEKKMHNRKSLNQYAYPQQITILFLLLFYFSHQLLSTDGAMRCYTCTSTEKGSQCETNPSTLPHGILDSCPREACTIVRVEEWPSQRVKYVYKSICL